MDDRVRADGKYDDRRCAAQPRDICVGCKDGRPREKKKIQNTKFKKKKYRQYLLGFIKRIRGGVLYFGRNLVLFTCVSGSARQQTIRSVRLVGYRRDRRYNCTCCTTTKM